MSETFFVPCSPGPCLYQKIANQGISGPQEFLNIFCHSEQCVPPWTQPSQEMFSAKTLQCAEQQKKQQRKYMHECVKNLVLKIECAKTISV
jgi:hypothetical protein